MTPRSACGASPQGGRHQRPGKAGSAVALVLACCAALVGCVGVGLSGVAAGTTRADVIARLGQPTRSVALPSGERLQYSQQPMGQYATMVDLDSAGRVVSARQVLTLAEFSRIVDGQWTRADVEREFGPPARVDGVASWRGDILTYRWNDGSDMFFFVYLDANQVVQRAHPGMEFVNAPDRE
jgi:hypothetical protein